MTKTITALLILLGFILPATQAQQSPKEASSLNYRIIGFSFPAVAKASGYKVEIAKGNYTNEAEFKKKTTLTTTCKTNKIIVEVPAFGAEYTWRATAVSNSKNATPLYHFSTAKSSNADTTVYRFRVVQNALKYKDAYVFTDGNKVMYNMRGEPVWFLPNIKGAVDDYAVIRDIKITPQNTITFLTYNMAYEINYDGEILWRAPNNGLVSGDSQEHYNHEFTRLANGHYMVLSHEVMPWEWMQTGNGDSVIILVNKKAVPVPGKKPAWRAQMGTIIEYDGQGHVVWSWKSSGYFKGENLQRMQGPMGFRESHENAFYFDEKNKVVYLSFKNTSQVLKVKYPEGTLLAAYEGRQGGNSLFSEQHACKVLPDGRLALYNNNMENENELPNVLFLQQPATPGGVLKVAWKYEHPDGSKGTRREPLTSGGNVIGLPDNSTLISSCVPYSNVFIVGLDKKIIWDAALEKKDATTQSWKPFPQYRASIITGRKRLEQLIWNAAVK
jgi:hypothetical protein